MLKQTEKDVSAAQVRVTPEELAAAITRLEARKDASHRKAEGTVSIGEVVQQLGLDSTPEEVLAEVQAGQTEQGKKRRRRLSARERFSLALATVLIGYTVWAAIPYMGGNPSSSANLAPTISFTPSVSYQATHILPDPNLLVTDTSGKLVMLSEVGDNQPVHCSYHSGRFQQYSPGDYSGNWTLIKHDGRIYIRGWMYKMSQKALQANGADISGAESAGSYVVPVTLPLHGFNVIPDAGSTSEFHAQDLHLDNHAYEKWQP